MRKVRWTFKRQTVKVIGGTRLANVIYWLEIQDYFGQTTAPFRVEKYACEVSVLPAEPID